MVQIKQKPQLHASWIDPHAKEIVRTLQKEGFISYLVGGCVRDLLAGIHPKDFDIATNAEPNQIRRKIWGSYVIGKRFRLVLVKRRDQQYEVATFRREAPVDVIAELSSEVSESEEAKTTEDIQTAGGLDKPAIQGDNFFGTPEQDAVRRDFTINALFYDPIKDELIDYIKGIEDIKSQTLRMIGDPDARIIEDPIRSFRAIRLAHKLGFRIESNLRTAILKNASSVTKSVLPRRREEYLKFLRLNDPVPAWMELYDLGIIEHALPSLLPVFEDNERRELFFHYIYRLKELCSNLQDSNELFAPLILGYLRAMQDHPEREILLGKLLKDELMLFKSEQAIIFGSLDLVENLNLVNNFKKRGSRRQQAFLKNELLPMALKIAQVEHAVSPTVLQFWREQIHLL